MLMTFLLHRWGSAIHTCLKDIKSWMSLLRTPGSVVIFVVFLFCFRGVFVFHGVFVLSPADWRRVPHDIFGIPSLVPHPPPIPLFQWWYVVFTWACHPSTPRLQRTCQRVTHGSLVLPVGRPATAHLLLMILVIPVMLVILLILLIRWFSCLSWYLCFLWGSLLLFLIVSFHCF